MLLEIVFTIAEGASPEDILKSGGLWWLLFIVFLETGVFFGVFLPGDSLLLTAGLLCGTTYLDVSIYELIVGLTAAGFLGAVAGYIFGRKTGSYLLRRRDSIFFRKKYLTMAEEYHHRYGNWSFIIGRFLPVARTFIPIIAGLVRSPWGAFVVYNVLGASLWATIMAGSGYWLGQRFPNIVTYLEWIVIALAIITSTPLVLSWLRRKRRKTSANKVLHQCEHQDSSRKILD